jgi:hypothetical protein
MPSARLMSALTATAPVSYTAAKTCAADRRPAVRPSHRLVPCVSPRNGRAVDKDWRGRVADRVGELAQARGSP